MNIVLLTWNPDKWNISDRQWAREIKQIQDSGFLYSQWSTGNNKKLIQPNDIAFLLRQGRDRGLVARGIITSHVFQETTWDDDAEAEAIANFAEVTWTSMLPIEKRLPIETLTKTFPNSSWTPFASGTTVDPAIHNQLINLWDQTVAKSGLVFSAGQTAHKRAMATPELIARHEGHCHTCKVDVNAMYQTDPALLLSPYHGPGDNVEVALCPNCLAVATANGTNLTIAQLERRIAITF